MITGAVQRPGAVVEMAGPLNEVVKAARARGVFIIHAPSSVTGFYKDTPQRKLAQSAPFAKTPVSLSTAQRWGTAWCWPDPQREPALPIDDSDMGCSCPVQCPVREAWTRQIATIELMPEDALTDDGQETWNLLQARGIDQVILCGVHLNMCVLGRPFGIRQMVHLGKKVALMRDLTDAMYNPEKPPKVSHFAGTDLVIEHVEKYWCPSFASADITGRAPFRFKGARTEEPNTLTAEEKKAGWQLLFDGRTTSGWRGYRSDRMPASWRVENGSLLSRRQKGESSGDIVTVKTYDDFELTLQWKMTPGGNSGVIYRASEERDNVWETGPEYQILDNTGHIDGLNPLSSAGACYAVFALAKDVTRPLGQWNDTRIVARGKHVEHWLNGEKLLEYDIDSKTWQAHVKTSKFYLTAYGQGNWGRALKGHIALQDYGGAIEFRSIKLRPLSSR